MDRLILAAVFSGLLLAAPVRCPAASAQGPTSRLSCNGSILKFEKLGDHRLVSYQDSYGHHIELWCTRRIFDAQFDLRVAMAPAAGKNDDPRDPVPPERLATVGGCFFDNGVNEGPIILTDTNGAYTKVEWVTEDPSHWRKYRFSYDFNTKLVTVTSMVQGCAPVTKRLAPQASYKSLAALLPHPEKDACAAGPVGHFNPAAPTP